MAPGKRPRKTQQITLRSLGELGPEWKAANLYSILGAQELSKAIGRVGIHRVAADMASAVQRHIFYAGSLEHRTLKYTQKTDIGTVCEASLLNSLGWQKNESGPDTTLAVKANGRTVLLDMDVKTSCTSVNRNTPDSKRMPSGWQISRECWDCVCVLISFCTYTNRLSIGALDCSVDGYLNPLNKKEGSGGPSRDDKRSVSPAGKANIVWAVVECPTPENSMTLDPEKFIGLKSEFDKIFASFMEQTRGKSPRKELV